MRVGGEGTAAARAHLFFAREEKRYCGMRPVFIPDGAENPFSSHKMYQLNGFRESTFPQNRELIVNYY